MEQRHHYQHFNERMKEPRRFIQVLSGPRQVGKTTLVNKLWKEIKLPWHYVSADGVANTNANWIEQQWHTAREKLKTQNAPGAILTIDEIQKIGNWSETIKKLWDEDTRNETPLKVILLGSSRLLLQQGLTESLAGRFESTYMGHWSFEEMKKKFGWTAKQFAWFGGYPGPAHMIGDEPRWKKYLDDSIIESSISKDILMLTRVDKPALMRKLFELGCAYSGQILSFTKMLGQLHDAGNTTTLSHYLNLLNTAGLLAGIEKFSTEKLSQRGSIPKFQVHNTALISAQDGHSFEEITAKPERWGRVVESAIGAHLLNHSLTERFNLYYWRHRNDEVDFVMERKGTVIGLEVKSGANSKMSGLEAFARTFHPKKTFLIGNGGMPWDEFLLINPSQLFV
jgi:uncharacterized protein